MTNEQLKEYLSMAAVQDFRDVMDAPYPGESEGSSLPYRRGQRNMLADPRKWCRNRQRPVWKRMARQAACFLLVGAIAFGAVMAASPAARAAVVKWFRTVFAEHAVFYQGPDAEPAKPTRQSELKDGDGNVIGTVTEVGNLIITEYNDYPEEWDDPDYVPGLSEESETSSDSPKPAEEEHTVTLDPTPSGSKKETFAAPHQYVPTWLPEGVRLSRIYGGNAYQDGNRACAWMYQDASGFLDFFADQSSSFTLSYMNLTEDMRQSVTVNGRPADFYDGEDGQYLFWDNGNTFFRLETLTFQPYDRETLIKIAESVQKVTLPRTYSMKWMPEGSRLMEGDTKLPGGSYRQFADGRDFYFTFLYSSSAAGSHLAEGANPEPVTVNGCSGVYYAAGGSLDEYSGYTRNTSEGEGGSETVSVFYEPRNKAALTWTNAEGVAFTISGAFEKDVLLKMAESVAPD